MAYFRGIHRLIGTNEFAPELVFTSIPGNEVFCGEEMEGKLEKIERPREREREEEKKTSL